MAVSLEVGELLGIHSDDFYKGNILPDLIKSSNSHYVTLGKYYLVPDVETFLKQSKYNDDLTKGYLTHLLLDRYFLEDYITNVKGYNDESLFTKDHIYRDYTNMNSRIIRRFNIDTCYVNFLLNELKSISEVKAYLVNKKAINTVIDGPLNHIDYEDFEKFLVDISKRISSDIRILTK